jgi:hypothetical protein
VDVALRDRLLLSIEGDRLAILCGAGLSMAHPTELPSAADLADICARQYQLFTGTELPAEIQGNLERIADHFLSLNRFRELLSFVPWELFYRRPNEGHTAISDFLCCGAVRLAASTNYDTHIEDAALELGEQDFRTALDGVEANEPPSHHRPLLKLHGCCHRDRMNTLWAHSQCVANDVLRDRLALSGEWLRGQLGGRDLVILGFWSDWDYLNDVLSTALTGSEPRTVVLVDPGDPTVLEAKASVLWSWANQPGVDFFHVRESADTFLDELRVAFSRGFIRQVLASGAPVFATLFEGTAPPTAALMDGLVASDLYSLRKDLSGCASRRPARSRKPDATTELAGAFILALLSAGGSLQGTCFVLGERRIRVINSASRLLSGIRSEFSDHLGVAHDCDTVICVGAIDDGAPGNLVRGEQEASIVRQGWGGEWLTHESAREQLRL